VEQTSLAEFGRIDRTGDPAHFVRFLDAASAEGSFQAYKRLLGQFLNLEPGVRLLDIGCGTGDDARAMAELVGPNGRVVGVDNSQAMITEAEKRAAGQPLSVEFRVADALHLPFPDDSFDGVRADRSPMHMPDPRQALAEMVRVVKPDGRVVVYEVDFETLVLDVDEKALARKMVRCWCDGFRDGWLGRRFPWMFRQVGLKEVTTVPHVLVLTPALAQLLVGETTVNRAVAQGTLTPAEGQAWLAHLDEVQRQGRFFSTMTGFLVAGRK
jgi:ubiquinone/menaquinone biosynthesis C-methylase UbiE